MGGHRREPADLTRRGHRFFLAATAFASDRVLLPTDLSHQVARVLRLRPGDSIVALDDTGKEYDVLLERVDGHATSGRVRASREARGEPRLRVTLYQALLSPDRLAFALQKGTEVGVAEFVPMETARTRPAERDAQSGRVERWRRIVREAAEQSGRGRLPAVSTVMAFEAALARAVAAGPALLAYERERDAGVAGALADLPPGEPVSLLLGPEGGFTEDEIALARDVGARTLSLGPRILRAETAGPLLAALVLFTAGEMEPPR